MVFNIFLYNLLKNPRIFSSAPLRYGNSLTLHMRKKRCKSVSDSGSKKKLLCQFRALCNSCSSQAATSTSTSPESRVMIVYPSVCPWVRPVSTGPALV